ncbi:MAG TPA: type I 3-dehydroquinate dehydratase, partial [Thermoanaerobaculia bacterium]|nr:type I 3-dehydroquinate dehydratase [Thermoanaerobaculia bacterium]
MHLVATIFEESRESAIAAIRALPAGGHDMVEVRLDAFEGGSADFGAFRAASSKPIILTNRGGAPPDIVAALAAGIEFVDVEYRPDRDLGPYRDRIVLSHHDFESMPDVGSLIEEMTAFRCAHTKIAVTPRTLRENEVLLESARPGLTIFGMGERGLYSRILAPFFGSELAFAGSAAPGQLSLETAGAIYGERGLPRPEKIFAVAGNPAGHSLSPSIHNPLFRSHGLPAAYTIASFESFDEIAAAFEQGRIAGLSVTAPFKDDALAFAQRCGAAIASNAHEAAAVNTLVRTARGIVADNTDVDGFETLLRDAAGRRSAVVGAGGTGRAAVVALRRLGREVVVYNRTARPGTQPLEALARCNADIVVNTL